MDIMPMTIMSGSELSQGRDTVSADKFDSHLAAQQVLASGRGNTGGPVKLFGSMILLARGKICEYASVVGP
jgi:hypothetical protein